MSSRTYARRTCHVCNELVSSAGAAWAAHSRKHAKAGELVALYSPVLEKTEYFTPEQARKYDDASHPNPAQWRKAES